MNIHIQFARYAIVGIVSNAVCYILYLTLTYAGMGHKTAMTLLYAVAVAQTFFFNRKWSFKHKGHMSSGFIRYIVSYALGYFINLVALIVLVDRMQYPHQIIQGIMIFVLAVMLFLLQKFWVFRPEEIV